MLRCNSYIATAALIILAVAEVARYPALAQEENLITNDKALIHFVMPKNWEFRRVLGPCIDLKLHRSTEKGQHLFRIRGQCGIRNALAPNGDCYGYSLVADGTIDTPVDAAIRKITLKLLCLG